MVDWREEARGAVIGAIDKRAAAAGTTLRISVAETVYLAGEILDEVTPVIERHLRVRRDEVAARRTSAEPMDALEAEIARLQREARAASEMGDDARTRNLLDDLHRAQQAWDELARPD